MTRLLQPFSLAGRILGIPLGPFPTHASDLNPLHVHSIGGQAGQALEPAPCIARRGVQASSPPPPSLGNAKCANITPDPPPRSRVREVKDGQGGCSRLSVFLFSIHSVSRVDHRMKGTLEIVLSRVADSHVARKFKRLQPNHHGQWLGCLAILPVVKRVKAAI